MIATDLLMGRCGPLSMDGRPDSSAYSDEHLVAAAYLVSLAYRFGRASGILKGRPAHEARELLGKRCEAAAHRSSDLYQWGHHVLTGVGVDLSRLPAVTRQWWRWVTSPATTASADDLPPDDYGETESLGSSESQARAQMWRSVRTQMPDVLLAAELLSPWLHQVRSQIPKRNS